MFFWGSGHKTIRKGVSDGIRCSKCIRTEGLTVQVDYDYSHIYWIFKSVKNVQAELICDYCGHAQRDSNLFTKLGGNPIPFMDRFGGAVLLVIVAGLVAFAILSQARRDSSGAIVSSGKVGAFDIELGDCFDDEDQSDEAETTQVLSVLAVPCDNPHDNEVFALYDLDLNTFPEGDALYDIAFDGCVQRFEPFVGRDYRVSSLYVQVLYPSRESWSEFSDREVVCFLYEGDLKKLTGSMRNSGI